MNLYLFSYHVLLSKIWWLPFEPLQELKNKVGFGGVLTSQNILNILHYGKLSYWNELIPGLTYFSSLFTGLNR